MKKRLQWGIIGTGGIARKFARGLKESLTGELAAVGSRAEETLRDFLKEFPARGHASYEALLADPGVEAVYISTPHPLHAEWAIRAARAGKHILCEKPLAMNAAEAGAMIQAAREAGVFLMEAFMYRCHPQTALLLDLIRSGRIGAVRLVQAEFSFRAPWNPAGRLLNRETGGGGILDVGCYCVSMARLIAGEEPITLNALGRIGETGVDEFAIAQLGFPGGIMAQLSAGIRVALDNRVRVWGEEGMIEVPSPWGGSRVAGESALLLRRTGEPEGKLVVRIERGIFAMEADAVAESLAAGQSPAMTWADSLGNMRTLDWWRREIGMRYNADVSE